MPAPVQVASARLTTLADSDRLKFHGAGMAFTVARADGSAAPGQVAVSVDYSGFAYAHGGNYADRLRLLRYPACFLTTPNEPACNTPTVVDVQANDPNGQTLSALVDVDPDPLVVGSPPRSFRGVATAPAPDPAPADGGSATGTPDPVAPDASVFVVSAATSGSSGNFAASPLDASATWQVGLQSGSFTSDYPIALPSPEAGATPTVGLDYDSASVDGRTSETNPQASWVGIGWDYQPGYVETSYDACDGHGHATYFDLCYVFNNAVLNLNGRTQRLVKDSGPTGAWRLGNDPGWLVTPHSNTGAPVNGDDQGWSWQLTSPDGTNYYFGQTIDSTWTVPVWSYPGANCLAKSTVWANAYCNKGWRWNLNKIVDVHGNTITFHYTKESNLYQSAIRSAPLSYTSGGVLDLISYGLPTGASSAAYKVSFVTTDRCNEHVNGGTAACTNSAGDFPDVPDDEKCLTGPCTNYSPSFFIDQMLSEIDVTAKTANGYSELDEYDVRHSFPDPDGSGPVGPSLWMTQVVHAGVDPVSGQRLELPRATWGGTPFANRADTAATGVTPLQEYRVTTVDNELGGELQVTYGQPDPCPLSYFTPTPDASLNTKDCYPQYFKPQGSSAPGWGWFDKWLVTRVVQAIPNLNEVVQSTADTTITSEPIVTDYAYSGGADWHHDEEQVRPTAQQSWSDYRGYGTVTVRERNVAGGAIATLPRSITVHVFFQGMNGDYKTDGTTRSASITNPDSLAVATDSDYMAGQEAYVIHDDAAGNVISHESTEYFRLVEATDTNNKTVNGTSADSTLPDGIAAMVLPLRTYSYQKTSAGSSRTTERALVRSGSSTNPRQITDGAVTANVEVGDKSISDPGANCTSTDYVSNATAWIIKPQTTTTYDGTAAGTVCNTANTIRAKSQTFYDGNTTYTLNTPPTKGDPIAVRSTVNVSTNQTVTTTATYNADGTVSATTDGRAHSTTIAYASTVYGQLASTTVTPPGADASDQTPRATTTTVNLRGEPTSVAAPNGATTSTDYDLLGRVTAIWAPTQNSYHATNCHPSFAASYSIAADKSVPAVTRTSTLISNGSTCTNDVRHDSWTFIDGWGRTREAQSSVYGHSDLNLATITRYGDRGLVAGQSEAIPVNHAHYPAGVALDQVPPDGVTFETRYSYDALGRQTNAVRTNVGQQLWGGTATATYADKVITTPPAPAPVVTTTLDPWGRPTAATQTGGALTSTVNYTYDPVGRLKTVDGAPPSSVHYVYGYDLLGRRTSTADPDTGIAVRDPVTGVTSVTPGNTSTTYDEDGNVTSVVENSGTPLTTTYDWLNRPTTIMTGATHLVEYSYDTASNGIGLPDTTTVHKTVGGSTSDWSVKTVGYNLNGQPLATRYTIPAVGGLANATSYDFTSGYTQGGQPLTQIYPAIGGLAAETLTVGYDLNPAPTPGTYGSDYTGLPVSLGSSYGAGTTYVTQPNLTYDTYNALTGITLTDGGTLNAGSTRRAYTYPTSAYRRLGNLTTTVGATLGTVVQNDDYTYNNADEATSVLDNVSATATCNTYDGLNRLNHSWTQATACGDGTSNTIADGPAPYNLGWNYNADGTLNTLTTNGTASTAARDAGSPHAIASVSGNTYTYDHGYQDSRTVGGVTTTLSWDALHHLDTTLTNSATTTYVEAPDGTRLARLDSDGSATVYLADTELSISNGALSTTRYYGFAGQTIGVRNNSGTLNWLLSDPQGTRTLAVSAATGTGGGVPARQYYTPYGAVRSGGGILPTTQAFLGHTQDTSGLVADGARYYDAAIGQFLSPDPIVDTSHNAALNRFAYGGDNPVLRSDPSGLAPAPEGSDHTAIHNWAIAKSTAEQSGQLTFESLIAWVQSKLEAQRQQANADARVRVIWEGHPELAQDIDYGLTNLVTLYGGGQLTGPELMMAVTEHQYEQVRLAMEALAQGELALAVSAVAQAAVAIATDGIGTIVSGASEGAEVGVVAKGAAPRFIGGAGGDTLDTSAVTIPKDKFGYLLDHSSKAGVFRGSMGFDQGSLDQALRAHLFDNLGSASGVEPMVGGGFKFSVRGPMTGPSGATWNIKSVWGIDLDGTVRLITATP